MLCELPFWRSFPFPSHSYLIQCCADLAASLFLMDANGKDLDLDSQIVASNARPSKVAAACSAGMCHCEVCATQCAKRARVSEP